MTSVSAPASAANLGPGFDVLALAVGLRLHASIEPADEWSLDSEGSSDAGALDMARRVAEAAVPGIGPRSISISSDIPVERGLGSSAALLVAVAAAATVEAGRGIDLEALHGVAAEVEGHPDNVAAAVHGGLVAVSWSDHVHRLEMHPSLFPLVAVPDHSLSTQAARDALSESVSRGIAVRTASRAVLLVEGLRTADRAAFRAAQGDEIHEPQRARLSPITNEMVSAALRAGALHAAWSGAGPSVVAIVDEDCEEEVRAAFEETLDGSGVVLDPGMARTGVEVE